MAGRDIPSLTYGAQSEYKRLYYSEPNAALKVQVTLQAGFGLVSSGTALAKNLSASGGIGKVVPYNPTTFTGAEAHPGRSYLVADSGSTASDLYVTINDSYKFGVGDDCIVNDNTTAAENLGAITAIDRTTEQHRAKITVTTATGGTSFTTARKAYLCVEAGDSSNNYSDCVGIIEKTVDTGTGTDAKGAVAVMILGNAVLYTGGLTNIDSAARTDISASTYGQFTYIR